MQKGLSPGPVCLAGDRASPCRAQDRAGIRAAAEGSPGHRSGKGPVESSGHTRLLSGARACCSTASTRSSRNEVRSEGRSGCNWALRRRHVRSKIALIRRVSPSRPGVVVGRHHHQDGHAGAGQFLLAQGAARHGRRVGGQDRRPREAHASTPAARRAARTPRSG